MRYTSKPQPKPGGRDEDALHMLPLLNLKVLHRDHHLNTQLARVFLFHERKKTPCRGQPVTKMVTTPDKGTQAFL